MPTPALGFVDSSAGTGALGFGGNPPRTRKRPDLCVEHGHPGVTFNPWLDRTWCLCGEVVREGDRSTHAACCDGPLEDALQPDGSYCNVTHRPDEGRFPAAMSLVDTGEVA